MSLPSPLHFPKLYVPLKLFFAINCSHEPKEMKFSCFQQTSSYTKLNEISGVEMRKNIMPGHFQDI